MTHTIKFAALELLTLIGMSIFAVGAVYFDVVALKNGLTEKSLTEFSQQLLLLLSAALFFYAGKKANDARPFNVFMGSMFTTMLVRECDVYFDVIQHGSWVYPATALILFTLVYTFKNKTHFFTALRSYFSTRSYIFVLIGFLLVIVFSRTFGSGNIIWKPLMGSDYHVIYKSAMQEGLELFGYLFILYGSVLQTLMIKNGIKRSA